MTGVGNRWIRLIGLLMGAAVLTVMLLCLGYRHYRANLLKPADPNGSPREFSVLSGWSFTRTAVELEKQGFVTNAGTLRLYARLNRSQTGIKYGDYMISPAMSPIEIIERLVSGKVITYCVTFPEGLTISEMATRWEASGYGSADNFKQAVLTHRHPDLPYPPTGWEGYLFPETYCFTKGYREEQLIEAMVQQLAECLKPEWLASARERNLDMHQVVTLASLIEKETGLPEERPLISAVFHNRLKNGMLLQCDPTVIYALGERYTGRLLTKHLETDMPYNTYIHPGLPPGPIGAPGMKSIEAACFPADADYLYFVADSSGGHVFSRSLTEHNRAVQRYRKWMAQKPGLQSNLRRQGNEE